MTDFFEFYDLYQVSEPHHNHSLILQSWIVEYKVVYVPNNAQMEQQIKRLVNDACSQVERDFGDRLRIAIGPADETIDPVPLYHYYTGHNEPNFRQALKNYANQIEKVCQSTRAFLVGEIIKVLIDRIAPQPLGSSSRISQFLELKLVNKRSSFINPQLVRNDSTVDLNNYILFTLERYTFASEHNCLFTCLLLELVRKFSRHCPPELAALRVDSDEPRNRFPFGMNKNKVTQLKKGLFDKWKNNEAPIEGVNEELASASIKFARAIGCENYLNLPVDLNGFLHVTNKLTKFGLRFALFDRSLNLLTATDITSHTNLDQNRQVILMLDDGHYHLINRYTSKDHIFCKFCLFHHNRTHKHECTKICHICKRSECLSESLSEDELICLKCNSVFRNLLCKAKHTNKDCLARQKKCKYCKEKTANNLNGYGHICTMFHCRVCDAVDQCLDHKCSLTGANQQIRHKLYHETPRLDKNEDFDFDISSLEEREKLIQKSFESNPLPPMKVQSIFLYYDLETAKVNTEETTEYSARGKYKNVLRPVVLSAQSECHGCVNDLNESEVIAIESQEENGDCLCGKIRWTFCSSNSNDDCVEDFILKLLMYTETRKQKCQILLVAHNGGRFDHHFLLHAIATRDAPIPDLYLKRGNSVIGMKSKNWKVLDSFRFMPLSLRAMPKAIGLDIELSKDYFPHELTTYHALQNGLPQLPAKEHFGYEKMKHQEKLDFDNWYSNQSTGHYDMKGIMIKYCVNDVKVLRLCCRKFIGNWYYRYNYNPFESYTLPSTVVNSMINSTPLSALIPLTPFHGYSRSKYTSTTCAAFLDVYEDILGRQLNGNRPMLIEREVKLSPKFYADGVVRLDDGRISKVIDFLGCYFHLCDVCGYNTTRDNLFTVKTITLPDGSKRTENIKIDKAYEQQIRTEKEKYCLKNGLEYIQIWEHEINCLDEQDLRKFKVKYDERYRALKTKPIKHREALIGGRTEAFRMFYECLPDEEIAYHDVNGLYPYVLMNGRFPIKDPIHFTREQIIRPYDKFIRYNFGSRAASLNPDSKVRFAALIKCTILPPRGLWLPVLPFRCKDKLFFPLCRTCTETESSHCTHSPDEREFEVTVTSFELELALDHNYQIIEIHQVEAYEMCAGPNEPGLPNPHREFIGKAMQMKAYAERTNNPSGRFLAKLAANSYWGALAKNSDNLSTIYFEDISKFYDLLNSESVQIRDVFSVGKHLKVNYRTKKEMIYTPKRTSLITAIFVTSQARIQLYKHMRAVGAARILYCDTDSVLWVKNKSDEVPFTLSSTCGDLSDEVSKDFPSGYIHKFVSLGPKSYCYEVHDRDTKQLLKSCMRMKGISFTGLNQNTSLSFKDMHDLLLGELDSISLEQQKFAVDGTTNTLHHEKYEKKVRVTMDKRIIHNNYSTSPFGYCSDENAATEHQIRQISLETIVEQDDEDVEPVNKRSRIENFNIIINRI